jgi:predicted nucleic acid-binding protein
MRVVDSSAWIEWLSGSDLGRRLASELPASDEWVVPTIIQYELKRWAIRSGSDPQAYAALAFSNKLILWPLDSDLAIKAADVAAHHSLAMADAIIYATAIDAGADLLTCDAHFANLPGVIYFAKAPSP